MSLLPGVLPVILQTMMISIFYLQKYEVMTQCSDCSYIFCSEECSASDQHQRECRLLSKLPQSKNQDVMLAILPVVRLLIIRKESGQDWSNIGRFYKVLNS